jgi:acyl-CoA thioesterase
MNEPTTNRFDRDTRVRSSSKSEHRANIDRGWWVIQGPNGGYIAAIMLRAITAAVDDAGRSPRSLTIHYLSPPVEGETRIETSVERSGRTLSTVSARMSQNGKLRALALAAISSPRAGHEFYHATMPDVPEPEVLEPRTGPGIPMNERYEYRFVPALGPHAASEHAITAAWIRPAEPHPLDHPLLAAYADALPPALFARATRAGEFGALPTVDLTVHFRMDPADAGVDADDFCLAVFRSRLAHRGYIEEDGEIWSRDGQLLAQSRQLAVILAP